ncbi:MAG: DUF4390 domain-containing protein [Fibrobacterota bacterium]
MNFILGLLVAARSLSFVTSLIGAPIGTGVSFTQPQLYLTEQRIEMSVSVSNAFPADLRKLAESGTEIPFYIYAEVMETGKETPVRKTVLENRFTFDLVRKHYRVTKNTRADTLVFSTLDSALVAAASAERFFLISPDALRGQSSYFISLYAILGTTRVEALQNSTLDLMYYWDFKRPSARTQSYTGEALRIRKRSSS